MIFRPRLLHRTERNVYFLAVGVLMLPMVMPNGLPVYYWAPLGCLGMVLSIFLWRCAFFYGRVSDQFNAQFLALASEFEDLFRKRTQAPDDIDLRIAVENNLCQQQELLRQWKKTLQIMSDDAT